MTCPAPLTLARFADHALEGEELAACEAHVAACASCQASVVLLREENAALQRAMQAAEVDGVIPAFVPRPTLPRVLSWFAWAALLAWAMNAAWTSLSSATELPSWLGWLAPDSSSVGIEMFITLVAFGIREGGNLLDTLINSSRWIALLAIGLAGAWYFLKRRVSVNQQLCLQVGLAAVLLGLGLPGQAIELRRDDTRVTIPADEIIEDTLVVISEEVLVEGTITGDLIAFGEEVRVSGEVGGMLVTAAETLDIEATVSGTILAAGETVNLRDASTKQNLFSAGETVTVHDSVQIGGNVAAAGAEVEINGQVARDLLAGAEHLTVGGSIAGNLRSYTERTDVDSGASIDGDLTVMVRDEEALQIGDGATISGSRDVQFWPKQPNRYLTVEFYIGETLSFLAAFITGLVLFYLFPSLREERLDNGNELLMAVGAGALALIATPIAAVIVAITLIGAPVGIIAFVLWLMSLYLGAVVSANLLGRLIVDPETHHPALPLLVGVLILSVLSMVPLLGGLVGFLATVLGVGVLVQWLRGTGSAVTA